MRHTREPVLHPVRIVDLRPTQITVGMREVREKRKRWRSKRDDKAGAFLATHMIPVVLGPKKRSYVVDHHHLSRALHEAGERNVLTTVVADLSALDEQSFWVNMDMRHWMHAYDADGVRRGHKDLPKSIDKLVDDPFRSLAGELRRVGGYAKDTTPFSEFLWADFLRRRMKREQVSRNFEKAIEMGLSLAKSQEAAYLPGWCGPSSEG
jgi:hypothetical protein